jgi:hypothetical protein
MSVGIFFESRFGFANKMAFRETRREFVISKCLLTPAVLIEMRHDLFADQSGCGIGRSGWCKP